MTNVPHGSNSTARSWLSPGLLVCVGVALAMWTWGAWIDPLVDFGRELYVPWQLSEGQVLYRDIAYFNGPLSAYWNALLFATCGVSLRTLVIANLLILTGVCALLFRLIGEVSDRLTATIACAMFLFMFCFGQLDGIANFNWVCPYSHEMTHGIALSLLAVWAITRPAPRVMLAGFTTGLVFLTKPEVFAACALAMVAALLLSRKRVVMFVATALVAPLAAFALLATALPADEALRGTLGGWLHVFHPDLAKLYFYRSSIGLDALGLRAAWIAACTAAWVVVLIPGYVVARRLEPGPKAMRIAIAVSILTFAAGGAACLFSPLGEPPWRYAYLALPLALAWITLAWRPRPLVLIAFAAGLLVKIVFNARVSNYGFGLAVPAVMLCFVALLHRIPRHIAARGGYALAFRLTGAALVALIVLAHGITYGFWLGYRTHRLGSGVGAIRMDDRADSFKKTIACLLQLEPNEHFVVLPEGVMFNYLTRRPNPTRYINFMPPELIMFGEDSIVKDLEHAKPTHMLLTARTTKEYGLPLFGRDYGEKIMRWVRTHYVPVFADGPEPLDAARLDDKKWGIRLLKRR